MPNEGNVSESVPAELNRSPMQVRAVPPADLELTSPFYSPAEVASLVNVSSATVLNWIKSGRLASVRLSERTIRIPRRSLQLLLAPGSLAEPQRVDLDEIPLHPD
jgi:excisionase family DNA binding protein